ncbi:MAG: trypsin-like peptidase domain-containing protein [Xenococcaceae cyanobacterium]
MSAPFESSVVRIYAKSGKVVGAGFLVSYKLILTCAHVVDDALGISRKTVRMPTEEVSLDFPLLPPGQMLKARVVFWRPVNPNEREEDIAALELENPLPQKAQPVLLIPSDDVWEHPFQVVGFPKGQPNGVWASGVLRKATAKEWVQLEDVNQTGFRIEAGFSGALVWNQKLQLVAGMAVSAEQERTEARAAFIIPAKLLLEALIQEFPELGDRPCPYRGLLTFQEKDAQFFFGREELTKELVAAVQNYKIVPVIGPSGSGKSSVVFAGLFPQLRSQPNWLIEDFRPKTYPFNELARALLRLTAPEAETKEEISKAIALAKQLKEEASALETLVSFILETKPNARLLLVADQFEEIYKTKDRQRFLKRLLEVVKKTPKLTLLFTMRADFMENALSDPILAEALDNDVKVKPMSPQQLQEAIEKPARGLVQIESRLTTRILEDALTETISFGSTPESGKEQKTEKAGYLPLVEFALEKLWEKQKNGLLTHQAYEEIAGVKGAITQHANQVFKKLSKDEREKARKIFIQLVHPGENNLHTRQIATRSQLGEDKWNLVTYLAGEDCRLVITNRNEVTKEETVELIHEALIREWQLLGNWIQDNRDFRIWQEQLRVEMRQWAAATENKDGELLPKARLTRAEYWLQEREDELSELEIEFIRESVKKRDRDRQRTITGLFIALVVTLGLALGAWLGWQTAEAEKKQKQGFQNRLFDALGVNSEELFLSNQEFKALIGSLRAGILLEQAGGAIANNQVKVVVMLHQLTVTDDFRESNSLIGHNSFVESLSFSPDGEIIVSGDWGGKIILWNRDGSQRKTLTEHDRIVNVSFSPDGEKIASASWDGTVKLWQRDGTFLRSLKEGNGSVNAVAFGPNSNLIASANDNTIELWELNGGLQKTLPGHSRSITSISFSPDSEIIASASQDGTIKLWNREEGTLKKTLSEHKDSVTSVSFSPDGEKIASASLDGTVNLWERDGTFIRTFEGHKDQIWGVTFSPDSQIIASASVDNTVKLWKLDGSLLDTLTGDSKDSEENGGFLDVAFSPDGQMIAAGSENSTVKIWQRNNPLQKILRGHQSLIVNVSFSPDSETIASASWDGTVKLWRRDGTPQGTLEGHSKGVESVSFSPDGNTIATASKDKTVRLWNRDGQWLRTLKGHNADVLDVTFSSNGEIIASASEDGTVKLWQREGSFPKTLEGHGAAVNSVSFSPNGKIIASGSWDKTVKLWQRDGTPITTLTEHEKSVLDVTFSPDGKILASASEDGTVKLWKINGNKQPTVIQEIYGECHADLNGGGGVLGVSFSPDNQLVATSCGDNTVKIWKRDGKLLTIFTGQEKADFWGISFSPDWQTLAAGSGDNTVVVWNLALKNLLIRGCDQLRNYLNTHPHVSDRDRSMCNDY